MKEYFFGNVPKYNDVQEFLLQTRSGIMCQYAFRQKYIKYIGFVLHTRETISKLVEMLKHKRVIEVGCGTGFLSRQLKNHHVNVKAIDCKKYSYGLDINYCKIHYHDAVHYIKKNRYDVIIMSWPDYDTDFAYNIASNMKKGTILIYQGEDYGGCTGNEKFFDYLDDYFDEINNDLYETHPKFYGIHDNWNIFRKRL